MTALETERQTKLLPTLGRGGYSFPCYSSPRQRERQRETEGDKQTDRGDHGIAPLYSTTAGATTAQKKGGVVVIRVFGSYRHPYLKNQMLSIGWILLLSCGLRSNVLSRLFVVWPLCCCCCLLLLLLLRCCRCK